MDKFPLTPSELGFPAKFREWRPNQADAINRILDCGKRFVGLSLPTGDGKSGVYVAAAVASGRRAVVLTSTKQLQTQLLSDFASLGMVDVRGRANYSCSMGPDINCEIGSLCRCRDATPTDLGPPSCPYRAAVYAASRSNLVVTNYSYWVFLNAYSEGLGSADLLVCDEAHNAPDEVCSAMTVTFDPEDVFRRLNADWPRDVDDMESWRAWAKSMLAQARTKLDELLLTLRISGPSRYLVHEVARQQALVRSLQTAVSMRGRWVSEPTRRNGYSLAPVWPADYAEQVLFLGVPKVVLISATIIPKTLEILGVPGGDYEFYEYPSSFPPRRCPVYYVPTVTVNHRWKQESVDRWLDRIDEIIGARLDRRGVIHSVSYERRDLILARSRYSDIMLSHSPGSEAAQRQLAQFRNTPPPVVLVSPSMTTGVDLAYEDCEYQIICKVPFPDTRSRIMQARCGRIENGKSREEGREYEIYSTIQILVQETGRGMRAADDQCESFIIDNQINWIEWKWKKLIPLWWRRWFRRVKNVPDPPPALVEQNTGRQPLPKEQS